MRILIGANDGHLAAYLARRGWQTVVDSTDRYLVSVDVALVRTDGAAWDLIRASAQPYLPIVVALSASVLAGPQLASLLDRGADVVLCEPERNLDLLEAQLRALRRRCRPRVIKVSTVRFLEDHRTIQIARTRIQLTRTEYALLRYLVARAPARATRAELSEAVLGTRSCANSRAVDMLLSRLRRHLGRFAAMLTNVRGEGIGVVEAWEAGKRSPPSSRS